MFPQDNNLIPVAEEAPCITYEQSQNLDTQYFVPYEQQLMPQSQQIAMQRYWQKVTDANISITKAACIEQVRTQAYLHRQQLKEEAAERKKAEFEELVLTKDGNFQVTTRNTSVNAIPRRICNATNFEFYLLKNPADTSEELLLVTCNVNGET